MPTVTVNPVNTIKVRVGTTNQPVVSGTTTFVGSGSAEQIAQEALDLANSAYEAANIAYAYANTKVAKDGDSMTDPLYFVTAISNTRNMVGVGNIQTANGIDLWANTGAEWAQLNYANTNFVYVDALGSYLQSDFAAVNAFGDGTIQLQTSNGKSMAVIVGSTPVFQVASNNDVFSTGTYFGVIDKVDGGVFT